MISDILSEAIIDIRKYQQDDSTYDDKVFEINMLVASMVRLQDKFNNPPFDNLSDELLALKDVQRRIALQESKVAEAILQRQTG